MSWSTSTASSLSVSAVEAPFAIALGFLVFVVVVIVIGGYFLGKSLKRQVEEALAATADDAEAQAEIRKKIVKAMFPPRFDV